MKQIKLSEYSLISNQELDERIRLLKISLKTDKLENTLHQSLREVRIEGEIEFLEYLKQLLIPSEKLAEVAFDEGTKAIILKVTNFDKNTIGYSKGFTTRQINEQVELHTRKYDKQDFLNSKIQID